MKILVEEDREEILNLLRNHSYLAVRNFMSQLPDLNRFLEEQTKKFKKEFPNLDIEIINKFLEKVKNAN